MSNTLEDRVKILEQEIQKKNHLIANLQKFSTASFLFGSYMHDMNHKFAHLSFLLSAHFDVCRKNGFDKYINEITLIFEDMQEINNTMRDAFRGWKAENIASIEKCIMAATKVAGSQLRKLNIRLEMDLDTISGNIRVPEREFTNVLLSVLMNAIEALREVSDRERIIQIQAVSDGESTSIAIKDNGQGIDNGMKTKIWEPGFTTKEGKSGLGMTWAKMFVVELLGGQITVESELGEFTKINIVLPKAQE